MCVVVGVVCVKVVGCVEKYVLGFFIFDVIYEYFFDFIDIGDYFVVVGFFGCVCGNKEFVVIFWWFKFFGQCCLESYGNIVE